MVRPVSGGWSRYKGGSMGQRQRVQGLTFGGPVSGAQASCSALNAEIPWVGGVPPGNKILVWVKEGNPREKEKRSWSHDGQRLE